MKKNIIRETADQLGLSVKELAELIGVSEGTLNNASSTGKISKQITASLELLKENKTLKNDLDLLYKLKDFFNK